MDKPQNIDRVATIGTGFFVLGVWTTLILGAIVPNEVDSLKKEKSQLEKVKVSLEFEIQNLRQEVLMKANRIEELESL